MVSMQTIAEEAGVSLTTVSLVLNGKAKNLRISSKTQNKIISIAKDLNYIPNVTAKKLSLYGSQSKPEITLLWSPIQSVSFLNTFINVSENMISKKESLPMKFIIEPFQIGNIESIENTIKSGQYNGVIAPPTSFDDIEFINSLNLKIPVVLLHGDSDLYSSIQLDNYEAGALAAKIFALLGHKNVALVTETLQKDNINILSREKGFKTVCEENNIIVETISAKIDNNAIVENLRYITEIGKSLAAKLLSKKTLPSAIFVLNDLVAFGLMNKLNSEGVRVPEDTHIIAFGDKFFPEISHPTITTIDFPSETFCKESILMMSKLLGNPNCPKIKKVIKSPVIFRESCPRPNNFRE